MWVLYVSSSSDSIFSLRVQDGVWPDLVVEHFITARVTTSRLLYKSSSFMPNSLSSPVRRCRHDAAHFLLLSYRPARSDSMANARCGIFYEVVCIIGLVGKRLGLTFSLYWLVTYSPPTAAGIGLTLQRAVTWHFVVSPDLRAENEEGDTYWNNLRFTNEASGGHLRKLLTQLSSSSSSSSALVKCSPLCSCRSLGRSTPVDITLMLEINTSGWSELSTLIIESAHWTHCLLMYIPKYVLK